MALIGVASMHELGKSGARGKQLGIEDQPWQSIPSWKPISPTLGDAVRDACALPNVVLPILQVVMSTNEPSLDVNTSGGRTCEFTYLLG
jgi:hypothetical protein